MLSGDARDVAQLRGFYGSRGSKKVDKVRNSQNGIRTLSFS